MINEDEITAIPVRDCPELGVTREDEWTVFNDPEYWVAMPVMQDAAEVLQKLRNSSRLKVHIFTSRPWPILSGLPLADARELARQWADKARSYSNEVWKNASWWLRLRSWFRAIWRSLPRSRVLRLSLLFRKDAPIDRITKLWLEKHGFQYDKILIEKAGEDEPSDPASLVHNRFYACRTESIRYFVEDDARKARKLAYICDVVFLIDHPYNRDAVLPSNVLRVASWREILDYLRDFS